MLNCYVHMCTVAGSSIDDTGVIVNIVPLANCSSSAMVFLIGGTVFTGE